MGAVLVMISNYFHDLSVALLASNVLVVWYLGRVLDESGARERVLPKVFARLARVTYGALGYVLVAGAVRAWFFMDFEWNPAVGRGQVPALVLKHVLLVGLTVFGMVAHDRCRRRYSVER